MILVLALAALAVYGVVFFIKRAGRPAEERDPHLRVLARTALGGTSAAAVLAVGTRAWLVGVSEGGVSLISEIGEGEALDAMLLAEAERNEDAGRGGFRSLFRKFRQEPSGPGPSAIEGIRRRRDRIRGL
jgi:flagellar protein FliO/FliZ